MELFLYCGVYLCNTGVCIGGGEFIVLIETELDERGECAVVVFLLGDVWLVLLGLLLLGLLLLWRRWGG